VVVALVIRIMLELWELCAHPAFSPSVEHLSVVLSSPEQLDVTYVPISPLSDA
jgi:hypothetical protein